MNEKRNRLVMNVDAAPAEPSPIKIVRTRSPIQRTSDAFAVDWQLEGFSAGWENNFAARVHKIASGLTNGRERQMISLVPPRLKRDEGATEPWPIKA